MNRQFSIEAIYQQFIDQGDKHRPWVFLHGNTQNSSCGQDIIQLANENGRSVLFYDLPGHGRSELEFDSYHFDDLVALNYALIQHYRLKQPVLCGHSLGGMIHAATIARYQLHDIDLILMGSLDCDPISAVATSSHSDALYHRQSIDDYINSGDGLFKKQRFYNYFDNRQLDDAFVDIINRRYTQPAANRCNLTTLSDYNVRHALQALNTRLYVLHGLNDDVIPKKLVRAMLAAHPNAKSTWFEQHGHNAFYQYPEHTRAHLIEWFFSQSSHNIE